MAVAIRPVTSVVGAEISGVDLREPLATTDVEAIEQALIDHLVVFFRDQHLTDAQQRDFAAQFGELEPFVLAPPANPDVPEMHALAFDNGAAALGSRVDSWHTDGTFMESPPLGTVLRAVELPAYGGDTCWANMYAAYEALSPALREMVEELDAEHDYMKVKYTTFDDFDDPEAELRKLRARYPLVRHPIVRTHPVTKRKLLYVNRNYATRIVGLTERENEMLLPFLFDHVRDPLFQCRFRWQPGSVAFWDNRSTQHYGVPDYPGRRVMHRIVIAGDKPFR
ncbi:MAG: TauD/TfdA family dioxygenase [Acidimicrobiales bacterium]